MLNDIKLSNALSKDLGKYYSMVKKRLAFCLMLSYYLDGPFLKSKLRAINHQRYITVNKDHVVRFKKKKAELSQEVDALLSRIMQKVLVHIQNKRGIGK